MSAYSIIVKDSICNASRVCYALGMKMIFFCIWHNRSGYLFCTCCSEITFLSAFDIWKSVVFFYIQKVVVSPHTLSLPVWISYCILAARLTMYFKTGQDVKVQDSPFWCSWWTCCIYLGYSLGLVMISYPWNLVFLSSPTPLLMPKTHLAKHLWIAALHP